MGTNQNSRAIDLLNKVYDELEKVDVSKLSMHEMGDFLEVVQKGRFLEAFGQVPSYGFGGCAPVYSVTEECKE